MKMLLGNELGSYSFNPAARTISISGTPANLRLDQVLIVTNVTRGVVIYNFAVSALGASILNNVLTLTYNTTAMSASDVLQIWIDIPVNNDYPQGSGVNGTTTLTNANTSYASHPTSTIPITLTLYNSSDTDMFWGYAALTSGGILFPSGGVISVNLGASQSLYLYCTSAGKVLNYTYKKIV